MRDVHLAIQTQQGAPGIDHHGRVVIDARHPPLEYRPDDRHLKLGGQPGEAFGGGPGNGFGQIEPLLFFLAAEVLRPEQFLHADDLRALARGLADAPFRLGQVFVGI